MEAGVRKSAHNLLMEELAACNKLIDVFPLPESFDPRKGPLQKNRRFGEVKTGQGRIAEDLGGTGRTRIVNGQVPSRTCNYAIGSSWFLPEPRGGNGRNQKESFLED